MNPLNWRALLTIGALVVLVVIIVNVAFSAIWTHGAPSGAYGNGSYGPGTLMGPSMWGGMGFFWIFPVIGLVFMLLFFGVIGRAFFGNTAQTRPTGSEACRNCGQAMEAAWIACPHCGAPRSQSGQLVARSSSEEPQQRYE